MPLKSNPYHDLFWWTYKQGLYSHFQSSYFLSMKQTWKLELPSIYSQSQAQIPTKQTLDSFTFQDKGQNLALENKKMHANYVYWGRKDHRVVMSSSESSYPHPMRIMRHNTCISDFKGHMNHRIAVLRILIPKICLALVSRTTKNFGFIELRAPLFFTNV